MTDKQIAATKLLALTKYEYQHHENNRFWDEPCVRLSDLRALIDEAPEVETPNNPDLKKLVGELVEALEHSRQCLELANMCGAINDTLWAGNAETLFDYMDAAIDRAKEYLK